MAGYRAFEDLIRTEIGLCDYVKTKMRVKKDMLLSFDEYASSFRPRGEFHPGLGGRQRAAAFCGFDPERKYVRHDPDDWSTRRLPPDTGEMLHTLANVSTMLVLLRHADRIKIGCATGGLGQLCRTDREHAWKGASYYPFTRMIRSAKGVSLRCAVTCETYDVPGYVIDDMNQYEGFENVETVQAAAALNEAEGELHLYVINAALEDAQELNVDARGFEGWEYAGHTALAAKDPEARNTWEDPERIVPEEVRGTSCVRGVLSAVLAPASWNEFVFLKK